MTTMGLQGPKNRQEDGITHQETVKDPFQPFGFEITTRYARYQRAGLIF